MNKTSALNLFCKIISVIAHPLLITTYLCALLLFFTKGLIGNFSFDKNLSLINLIFICTFILPLLVVILYLITKDGTFHLKNILIEDANKRVIPFTLVAVIYAYLSYFLFTNWYSQIIIAIVFASISLSIFTSAIISIFWKISIHSVGIGGLTGFISIIYLKYFQFDLLIALFISILMSGIIMSSRIHLNAHYHSQVYSGWLLGFVLCYSSLYFL
ncbi:MAG: hypothetical protein EAZ07_07075 [Cytophagales bacterium]|nr:MAG: hypothetical protein EAZ07_07075 [Cytophagales bacterium]